MLALVLAAAIGWVTGAASAQEPEAMVFPSPVAPRGAPATEPVVAAEQVVAGLSSDAIGIHTSFDGSEIIIYGAVRRETPIPERELHVITTVEGPSRSVTVRRKERRLGIWVNIDSVVVGAAPSFYAVATTAPLRRILKPEEDAQQRISIPMAMRAFARPVAVADPADFTGAMIRQRIAEGAYRLDEGAVHLVEDTLFRADVRLPANLVEGSYRTRIFLLRGGEIIDVYSAPLEVRKVGLERWLYRLAYDRPFLYGILSLFIAGFAGWAASSVFRALQRK